jgi:hypothetical protein
MRKSAIVFAASFCAGLALAKPAPSARHRARKFRVVGAGGRVRVFAGTTDDGGCVIRVSGRPGAGLETGLDANGLPFLRLSGSGSGMALGRVEGPKASPSLLFQHHGPAKIVLGLRAPKSGTPPFLERVGPDGTKSEFLEQ